MDHQHSIANHQSMAYSPNNQGEYATMILTFICVVSSEKVYMYEVFIQEMCNSWQK